MSIGCKRPKPSAMRRCCIWKQPHRPGCSWKRNGKPRRFFSSTSFTTTRRQPSERVQTPVVSRWRLSPRRGCHRTGIRRPLVGNFRIAGAAFASRLRSISLAPRPLSGLVLRLAGFCSGPYRATNHGRTCKRAGGMGLARLGFESSRLWRCAACSQGCSNHWLWTG